MSFQESLVSKLQDAFSYVIHFESASDVKRKPAVVDQIIAASAAADTDDDYKKRLGEALSKISTRNLDTLLAKNVAVALDAALGAPLHADTPDLTLDGKFTPPGREGPAGGTLTVLDYPELQENASTAIEKFARMLRKQTPTTELYGLRSTTIAGGEGMVSTVSVVEWIAPEADHRVQRPAAKSGLKR